MRIQLLAQAKGLPPNVLAARANVRPGKLDAILAGTAEPTLSEKARLARALGVALTDLATLPAPGVENDPLWLEIRETLEGFSARDRHEYLVVMRHALGREVARIKMTRRVSNV
jgi:transcriptional regulator with XRE-family HTH domain